jgi:hypothetical protein
MHMTMFTELQWWLFGLSSCITFACYHGIPNALHRTSIEGASQAAKSGAFETFVRLCGTDHMVMLVGMYAMTAGWGGAGSPMSWAVVVSSMLVAAISLISWIVIRRAGHGRSRG